ncbi:MAG: hypothetical protein RL885_33375 [Planctomycetota bacterium]
MRVSILLIFVGLLNACGSDAEPDSARPIGQVEKERSEQSDARVDPRPVVPGPTIIRTRDEERPRVPFQPGLPTLYIPKPAEDIGIDPSVLQYIVWPDRYYDTLQHIREHGEPPPGMHPRVMRPRER